MSVSQHFCEAIHYLSQIVDFTLVSSSRSREENLIKNIKKTYIDKLGIFTDRFSLFSLFGYLIEAKCARSCKNTKKCF